MKPKTTFTSPVITLIHERDTQNFSVYSAEPNGTIVRDLIYLSTDWIHSWFDGHTPDTMYMSINGSITNDVGEVGLET